MSHNMQTPESQFNNPEYLSQEGLEKLKKEYEELTKVRRFEFAKKIEDALAQGDLSENAEYEIVKEEQLRNEARIVEIEDILSRAVLISKESGGTYVRLGSSVFLKKEGSDAIDKYSLVGPAEADSLAGKISHESPLGTALLGRKKGEKVRAITPSGEINYTIIDVG